MLLGAEFCAQSAYLWRILGYIVLILRIAIPLILIVLGMVDLGKAVVASKDDAINKAVSQLIRRFIAAVAVFFVPIIVSALFNVLKLADITSGDANICFQCVTNVNGDGCDTSNAIKPIGQ